MSLGFHRAGFRSVAAVEINDAARISHEKNFGERSYQGEYRAFADVTKTTPREAVAHLAGQRGVERAIDVVIGGPPCQAFSRLGRAALWRLAGKDNAHGEDERATMYHHYLKYVAELQPIAFVMENVREIGKFVGRNIAEEIAVTADEMGYETRYCLLNAAWYGVPQLRERMFIVAVRKELGFIPEFPPIQYEYELPIGYSTSRSGTGFTQVLAPSDHYVDHADTAKSLKPAVPVGAAFIDLPKITEHLDGRAGKGHRRRINDRFQYSDRSSDFSKEMRNWPEFESADTFCGHVIRYTPRDYETFRRMPTGGMYPAALETARIIFRERLQEKEAQTGRAIKEGTEEWDKLYASIVPPYKDNRYPNKFRKMSKDEPARTVPAHIGKDSYSHIHFDSDQARCISLREAARLQSFPDAFHLEGSMNTQLTQIGNAVPPLLAFAVANSLRRQISLASKRILQDNSILDAAE
jgi:DNA (cytosine-5)-methyltransferase 1